MGTEESLRALQSYDRDLHALLEQGNLGSSSLERMSNLAYGRMAKGYTSTVTRGKGIVEAVEVAHVLVERSRKEKAPVSSVLPLLIALVKKGAGIALAKRALSQWEGEYFTSEENENRVALRNALNS